MDKRLVAITGLVVIVAAIGTAVASVAPQAVSSETGSTVSASPTSAAIPSPSATVSTPASPTAAVSAYRDGLYLAAGSYDSPGGRESVSVTLTLKNGVITESLATVTSNNPTGRLYQAKFLAGYKSLVVGKSIAGLYLTKVSGSSLTPTGFNNAVAKIKVQAKA